MRVFIVKHEKYLGDLKATQLQSGEWLTAFGEQET